MQSTRKRAPLCRRVLAALSATSLLLAPFAGAAPHSTLDNFEPVNRLKRSDFHVDQTASSFVERLPTSSQQAVIDAFLDEHPGATLRWDRRAGAVSAIFGFAGPASSAPANIAALDFIASHAELLGVSSLDQLAIAPWKTKSLFGGTLMRFEQQLGGVPVEGGGLGVLVDSEGRVRAIAGPMRPGLDVDLDPTLPAAEAVAAAALDISPFARNLPDHAMALLEPAFEIIEGQLGPLVMSPRPELRVLPTLDGARLAWTFTYYARDPFTVSNYSFDAHDGKLLTRRSLISTAQEEEAVQFTADYFPTAPAITPGLQNEGRILDVDGGEVGRPQGQSRIALRKFHPSNVVTGVNGKLTGDHALIQNALPFSAPFPGAALGQWHFAQNEQPLEGRTEERDHFAEPAQHQDEISQFIYITALIEYLDYLHRDGDLAHSRGFGGEGSFPDTYPNDSVPLSGTVHLPNILEDACGDLAEPGTEEFLETLLACDNALAVNATQIVGTDAVVINPTLYGHGYLFNDLAVDFGVPMHEGTHATITPIAGFEGPIEGNALNEGQADLFAYTIGEDPRLGAYTVNAFRLRQLLSDSGIDPDSFEFIRSANSQIRYSQLGTRLIGGVPSFEEHRDGEIYAGAMWDLRQLMLDFQRGGPFVRPNPVTGEFSDVIELGKETWERIFLGSMYVLGAYDPDTFVAARDAVLIADSMLYPANPVDPASKGRHHALIEQVFAARELGYNAEPPIAGRQMISTAVSPFTAAQERPPAPQNVTAEPEGRDGIEIRWDAVDDAFAYQVLKRAADAPAQLRLFTGVAGREYADGDVPEQLAGYTHVEFVHDAATAFVDRGQALGRSSSLGLDSLGFDYVVRSIRLNDNGQVGFSDLSGTAQVALEGRDVTGSLTSAISNVDLAAGVFSFDLALTNESGAGDFDGTVYTPIQFKVIGISDPSVTARNADNGGTGQTGDEATYEFAQSLAVGETSNVRRLEFDNPNGRLFTIDAVISAQVQVDAVAATGSQPADGTIDNQPRPEVLLYDEQFTGTVLIGSGGAVLVDGVDYVDVRFTAKDSAVGVTGVLSASPSVSPYPDLDFALLDANGNELASSGNFGPDEEVQAVLVGGRDYVYRVIGFANAPTTFRIDSQQQVTDPADAGVASGGIESSDSAAYLLRLTFDPLTGQISGTTLD